MHSSTISKKELHALLTASASHCLTYHLFSRFFGQVLCSTVGVVQKHRFSLVRREPRLCSRDNDERHHRPVMASAPDRRHWWWGGGGQNLSHTKLNWCFCSLLLLPCCCSRRLLKSYRVSLRVQLASLSYAARSQKLMISSVLHHLDPGDDERLVTIQLGTLITLD